MNKLTTVFLFLIMSFASIANAAIEVPDVSTMSTEQVEMMKKQIELREQSTTSAASTVSEWATVGKNIGEGLVGAAKELGIAANEFANTNVGKMTIAVLLWHFFGKSMVMLAFIIIYPMTIPFIIRYLKDIIIGYSYKSKTYVNMFGKETTTQIKDYNEATSDQTLGMIILTMALITIEIAFIAAL